MITESMANGLTLTELSNRLADHEDAFLRYYARRVIEGVEAEVERVTEMREEEESQFEYDLEELKDNVRSILADGETLEEVTKQLEVLIA